MSKTPEHIRPGQKASISREYIRGIGDELIDVTSMSHPDPNWRHVDANGHLHQWVRDGERWTLPTLTQITDVEADDEYPGVYHYECAQCCGDVRDD